MESNKKAVLLINLGSPDGPDKKSVKKYLREFLMDSRVLDMPWLLRKFLLEFFILPKRPAKSAAAYQAIWWKEGSPLVVISRKVEQALRKRIKVPLGLCMRYGKPSVQYELNRLVKQHPSIEEIFLIPLYPHYAMSSFETAVEKVKQELAKKYKNIKLKVQPPYYKDEPYIAALSDSIKPYLDAPYDRILFNYHGIPERHLKISDPTSQHCLASGDCCENNSIAHKTCYRHQIIETTKAVAKRLNLDEADYEISFQSRLGRDAWLTPFTDHVIEQFPDKGVQNLVVICASFVADCLETLEEIGMEAKDSFLQAGGKNFTLVPCLNEQEAWIDLLADWTNEFALDDTIHLKEENQSASISL